MCDSASSHITDFKFIMLTTLLKPENEINFTVESKLNLFRNEINFKCMWFGLYRHLLSNLVCLTCYY